MVLAALIFLISFSAACCSFCFFPSPLFANKALICQWAGPPWLLAQNQPNLLRCCPAYMSMRLMARPAWRGLCRGSWHHGPDGAAHGTTALLARPCWRSPLGAARLARPAWRGPVGAARWRSSWRGPLGAARLARPAWRGSQLMARPSWRGSWHGPHCCTPLLLDAPRPAGAAGGRGVVASAAGVGGHIFPPLPPAPPASRFARAGSFTPIHLVRHWNAGPHVLLRARGRRPPMGPSSEDEPPGQFKQNHVRTGRLFPHVLCCFTTLARLITWSAGKNCADSASTSRGCYGTAPTSRHAGATARHTGVMSRGQLYPPSPAPRFARAGSYIPIHRVRHWDVDPQSPCYLAGPRPPSTHGALIGRRACGQFKQITVRTADRFHLRGCATTLAR